MTVAKTTGLAKVNFWVSYPQKPLIFTGFGSLLVLDMVRKKTAQASALTLGKGLNTLPLLEAVCL